MTPFARSIPLCSIADGLVYEANGHGGRALEAAIHAGEVPGVLDLCLSELAGELFGGHFGAGPDRLTAAAMTGVPQVVAPGGLEAIAFRDPGSVPEQYWSRSQYVLKNGITLVRTSAEECDRLGQELAQKVSAAKGPTVVLLPLGGFGRLAAPGGFLADAAADRALLESFQNWIYGVRVLELPLNATDPEFVAAATRELETLLAATGDHSPLP